ncbi:MAG: nucleotidyltransferase [Acidobacteriota bacterium]
MSDELEVLKLVTRRLKEAGIEYMITGSTAVNFYSVPRMTRDIDIIIELSLNNIEKIENLFSDEFYMDREAIYKAVVQKGIFNIIHNSYLVKIDFIIRKDSDFHREEFRNKRRIIVETVNMNVVSPEDLVLSKLFWAKESKSEVHINDVRNLLNNVKDLNIEYISYWVNKLGVDELYKEVLK